MRVCEPCQVGNKAALSRTFHVPQGSRVELCHPRCTAFVCQKYEYPKVCCGVVDLSGKAMTSNTMPVWPRSVPMKMTLETIESYMKDCTLCPRQCHAGRSLGQTGFCRQGAQVKAARAALHFWEEPCISGDCGSGTVFFSGCSLQCVFCQNHSIALGETGRIISLERLCQIYLELQDQGAANINLVTAGHFLPQVAYSLELARMQGLAIPVVYNTGGYESVSTLKLLDGLVDIYLPDLKYHSPELSARYAKAPDYFGKAAAAVAEMYRQVGTPVFAPDTGMMKRGVIVRHLLLPGQTGDSKRILRYLHDTYGDDIYISIMNQYTPLAQAAKIPGLDRPVSDAEYARVLDFAERIGIEKGFWQTGETCSESFIPPFGYQGI